jgi:hypothetical protein
MIIEHMATTARDNAKARAGAGWSLFGPKLQEALIAREALALIITYEWNEGWQRAGQLAHLVLSDTKVEG